MSDPHCVIGRVTLKDSDCELVVLDGGGPQPMAVSLISAARQAAIAQPDPTGFVVLSWDAEGMYEFHCKQDGGPIPCSLLPSWAAEVIRRETITTHVVRENSKNKSDE